MSALAISEIRKTLRTGFLARARGESPAQLALAIFGEAAILFTGHKSKLTAASGQVWRLAVACGLLSVNCGGGGEVLLKMRPASGILPV
jgi:hypothetical protein